MKKEISKLSFFLLSCLLLLSDIHAKGREMESDRIREIWEGGERDEIAVKRGM
jgi:hypothetical protein